MSERDSLGLASEPITRVTACDIESGESETQEVAHDYVIVTSGNCSIENIAVMPNGTHVITVKGVEPA